MQISLNRFINWYLDDRSLVLELDGTNRPNEVARFISDAYKREIEFAKPTRPHRVDKFSISQYDSKEYVRSDKRYRTKIDDFCKFIERNFEEYVTRFILHGSLASLDYSRGWSDVDTFVVISDSTLTDSSKLVQFRDLCLRVKKLMYEICPLQHHGLILFSEYDLNRYSDSFIPGEALEHSLEILQPMNREIELNYIGTANAQQAVSRLIALENDLKEACGRGYICHHPYRGECLQNRFKNSSNAMFQLFWLLGNVMTMPAYLLAAKGEPSSKKASFGKALSLYDGLSQQFINQSSMVRSLWQEREGCDYRLNAIPGWIQDVIPSDYLGLAHHVVENTLRLVEGSELT